MTITPNPPPQLPGMAEVRLSRLPAWLRLLLLHDGTLTAALESCLLQRVALQVLSHRQEPADDQMQASVCVTRGTIVIHRLGIIRHSATSEVLVETTAVVVPQRLPASFGSQLSSSPRGLGEALVRLGLRNRRELIGCGRPTSSADLVRRYRILVAEHPVSWVQERFKMNGLVAAASGQL